MRALTTPKARAYGAPLKRLSTVQKPTRWQVSESASGTAARRLRLPDVEVLAAVAATGSLGRAAATLGVSRPAVSQAVAKLEAAVGAPLVERGSDGAALTPAGEAVLQRGGEAADALGQAVRDVAFLSELGAAEIRVGASESYIGGGVLADAIDRLGRRHPRLAVTVVEANTAGGNYGGLRDRSLDVVLGRTAIAALPEDVRQEVLHHEEILVLAGAASAWARRTAGLALADLLGARWVLAPPGTAVQSLVAGGFRAAGLQPPRAAVTTYSMQLRLQLLARGDYLSSLPASLLRNYERRWDLVALPFTLGAPLPVVAVTLRRRAGGPALEAFLRELRAATRDALAAAAVAPR